MSQTPDEELVRRLLAESRADEPMPADVAARLDGVLDDLAGERRTVVAIRRSGHARRRRWAAALVAAAAVVVGGVSLRSMTASSPDMATSGGAASDSAGGRADEGAKVAPLATGGVAELHRATLSADVRRAAHAPLASPGPSREGSFVCAPADWGPGTAVAARLDGVDAVLVLRPPADGRQVADVLECGTARVLASVTVPAR